MEKPASLAGEGGDDVDGQFMKKLLQSVRPKHLIREEQDLAALQDASRNLKLAGGPSIDMATSPVRREQYSEFVLSEQGYAEKLAPGTFDSQELKMLVSKLQDWINATLAARRMVIRDIFLDLYDGVVLEDLLDALMDTEPVAGKKTVGGVWDKNNVERVLSRINNALGLGETSPQWSVDRINGKEVIGTLHLLVAMAHHFKPNLVLPDNVVIRIYCMQHTRDKMQQTWRHEQITGNERARRAARRLSRNALDDGGETDAFDKLFSQAPERVEAVKASLLTFANKHLARLEWNRGNPTPVADLAHDLHDGLLLIHLLALLGGYFVPVHEYHPNPIHQLQKVTNMGLVFRLMASEGMSTRGNPDDIVNRDIKSTLRVMYAIFSAYKQVQVGVTAASTTSTTTSQHAEAVAPRQTQMTSPRPAEGVTPRPAAVAGPTDPEKPKKRLSTSTVV